MDNFRYIDNVSSFALDQNKCIGCGQCTVVCPHRLLSLEDKKAVISDIDLCMECGACQTNCPTGAVSMTPGVGCAAYIVAKWINALTGRKLAKGCC